MFYIQYDRKNAVFNTLTIRRKNFVLKLVLTLTIFYENLFQNNISKSLCDGKTFLSDIHLPTIKMLNHMLI